MARTWNAAAVQLDLDTAVALYNANALNLDLLSDGGSALPEYRISGQVRVNGVAAPGRALSILSVAPNGIVAVADGVTDANYPSTCTRPTASGGRCQEPLNPAVCEAIKARGIRIAVLYTTYLPLDNDWYRNWIAPFQPTIGTKMQSCASPGLYFEVSPTQGISTAMTALFQKAVATARLTQ